MDRLDAMRLFVAAVDEGSLAAAARRHGRSAAAATRAVAALEALAGDTLLLRSTRRLSLTAEGERHVAIWRDVLERLGAIDEDAAGRRTAGTLVATAPALFGRLTVMPVVEGFLRAWPEVSMRLLLLDRVMDLAGEGVDAAVRLAPLPDSGLTAVRLGEVRRLVCASPEYVAQFGAPDRPEALAGHACVGSDGESQRALWAFQVRSGGRAAVRSVGVRTRLSVSSAGAAIDAARRGFGIVRPLSYQVAEDLAAGRLVRLLAACEPPPTPVHLVFRAGAAKRGALRMFVDHAVPLLRRALAG